MGRHAGVDDNAPFGLAANPKSKFELATLYGFKPILVTYFAAATAVLKTPRLRNGEHQSQSR